MARVKAVVEMVGIRIAPTKLRVSVAQKRDQKMSQ